MADGNFAAGSTTPALTPEQLLEQRDFKDKKTVTMLFQKPVMFQVDGARKVYYPEGVHEVPDALKDHWWLKAHGIRGYEKPPLPEPVKTVIIGEAYVEFLQSRGYSVKSVGEAQAFFSRIDDKDKPGFLAEAAEWFAEKWKQKSMVPASAEVAATAQVNTTTTVGAPATTTTAPSGGKKNGGKAPIADQLT